MTEKVILDWIKANTYMSDDYRKKVVATALEHYPQASEELKKYALKILKRTIAPRGFRPFPQAPAGVTRRETTERFQKRNDVATAVIVLWSEKEADLIQTLKDHVSKEGIFINDTWGWKDAANGFLDFDDVPELNAIAEKLAENTPEERDNYLLAALWLSCGQTNIDEGTDTSAGEGEINKDISVQELDENEINTVDDTVSDNTEVAAEPPQTLSEQSLSLAELSAAWKEALKTNSVQKSTTLGQIKTVQKAAENTALDELALEADRLNDAVVAWQEIYSSIGKLTDKIETKISAEFEARPGILHFFAEKHSFAIEPMATLSPSEKELEIKKSLEALNEYDQKHQELLKKVDAVQNELLQLKDELTIWHEGDADEQEEILADQPIESLSIAEIQAALDELIIRRDKKKKMRTQARELCKVRIQENLGVLKNKEYGETINGLTIDELAQKDSNKLSDQELRDLDKDIAKAHKIASAQSNEPSKSSALAKQLIKEWDETLFCDLLEELASENKNIETLLLEISATATKPVTTKRVFSRPIVQSLIKGLGEISPAPHDFAQNLAQNLFSNWETEDELSQIEKNILLLSAKFSSEGKLSEGFLWGVAEQDWPIPTMQSWTKLWKAVLHGSSLQIFTDQKLAILEEQLENEHKKVEKMFAHDGGFYARLASINSFRHRKMMNESIMPKLEKFYFQLEKAKEKAHESSTIKEFESILQRMDEEFAEDKLDDFYETSISEHEINDNPFHKRTTVRVIKNTTEKLLTYTRFFLEYEETKPNRENGIAYQNLLDELSQVKNIHPITFSALENITQTPLKSTKEEKQAQPQAGERKIITKLLSDSTYIFRLPKTISLLVNHEFSWEQLLESLLSDINQPRGEDQIVAYLLDNGVTRQFDVMSSALSIENRQKAQTLDAKLLRETRKKENEYIALGGDSDDIVYSLNLGRWGYLAARLGSDIDALREVEEEKYKEVKEKSSAYRRRINRLDEKIFDERSEIPHDISTELEKALDFARKASGKKEIFSELDKHLEEIEYRLDRKAWNNSTGKREIAASTDEIKRLLEENLAEQTDEVDLQDILDAFDNQSSSNSLGLETLDESTKNTRAQIIYSWERLKNIDNFEESALTDLEKNDLVKLFRYFSRMIKLAREQRYLSPFSKKPRFYHEIRRLQFPRSAALTKPVLMIALTGKSPENTYIQELEGFFEHENVLATYIVLLFVPGDSKKVEKRFSSSFMKQGLVLINEKALKKILLAEKNSQFVPVDILRPMMLQATSENVDIFTVNQSVNSKTSIFVGREDAISRISASNDSYAIHGGRRIGKSSVLGAIKDRLERRGQKVVFMSLEGEKTYKDENILPRIASEIGIREQYDVNKDFKEALFSYFEEDESRNLVLIIDEIDRYIVDNPERHILLEILRAAAGEFGNRFRVIIAGFMNLYDCLQGRVPYTPQSNPWGRMLTNLGSLGNLTAPSAENIVTVGFQSILGWEFKHRTIPRKIVEKTSGHPAFVQYFCRQVQERVRLRGDRLVTLEDVDAVFKDDDPSNSFIAYVNATLTMNFADPSYFDKTTGEKLETELVESVPQFLLAYLANFHADSPTFTLAQIQDITSLISPPIPNSVLKRSLELLEETSVIREHSAQLYSFTVPDYPEILKRLGEARLDNIENNVKEFLSRIDENVYK